MIGACRARITMIDSVLAAYIQFASGDGLGILLSSVTPARKVELGVALGDLYRATRGAIWRRLWPR